MPVETVTLQQAYRFALDPTPTQARAFASHAGGARYAFNWGLARTAEALDAYAAEKAAGAEKPTTKIPSHFDLCKAWTVFKDDPASGVPWVGENFVGTYQASLRDAAGAWKNFFASRKGKRAGRRVGRPRFKKKGRARDSFQVHGGTLQVVDARHVKLPKIGTVRVHEPTRKLGRRLRAGTARIVRGTVSRTADRWYIALTVEVEREIRTGPSARQRAGGTIGVDLGVRSLVVLSDGTDVPRPGHLDGSLERLRRAQRHLSRCADGSRRRSRAQRRVARLHARVAALRLDSTHKLTSRLIHSYERIGVEGWDVQATAQHGSKQLPRALRAARNRALADANLGELRWQLECKARWYGATVVVADRHEATGRTCSACGAVRTKPLPPAEEQFRCLFCGYTAGRRLNTARLLAGVAGSSGVVVRGHDGAPSGGEPVNARGGPVSPDTSRGVGRGPVKREARARPSGRGQTGTPGG